MKYTKGKSKNNEQNTNTKQLKIVIQVTSYTWFLWICDWLNHNLRDFQDDDDDCVLQCSKMFPSPGFLCSSDQFSTGCWSKATPMMIRRIIVVWWFQSNNCHDIDDDHKRCSNWQKDTEKIIFMNILIMILVFPWNKHISF